MISIKTLADAPNLTSIPASYIFNTNPNEVIASEPHVPIPTIDYSLLTSGTPQQRATTIEHLGKACQEWGFFMVINHGVSERLRKEVIGVCEEFFDMNEEEKKKYAGTHMLDPIRCGTSFNTATDKVLFWKDYLKVFVHPEFHSPDKPARFGDILSDYSKKTQALAWELLKGISLSLGLEELYIHKAMSLEKGTQVFVANLYPPCPQPELAMGLPQHTDHGLLTLLIQNDVGGLQLVHDGKWVKIDPIPNSFLVNTGDHLEILSNGKYKSVVHRAVVNNSATRISIAMPHGPPMETVIGPASELTDDESHPPAYGKMKYRDYLELKQNGPLHGKSTLDFVRIERAAK